VVRVALLTYSTKPRGGVVHTLELGEAMYRAGMDVCVVTLGDPAQGLYRPTRVPTLVIPAPAPRDTLEERVFASVDALEAGLRPVADRFDILHSQDCISARAAARIRDAGAPVRVLRTVHHIDDFTTPALINCQLRAIEEPDLVLVVSRQWQEILRDEYGVAAEVVPNGVDRSRFGPIGAGRRAELRRQAGLSFRDERMLFLSVGGLEPRKGSLHLVRALAEVRRRVEPAPVLAVLGGHSFQDYRAYRDACLAEIERLGMRLGEDVVQLGTVSDADLPGWYRAADALAFPSTKEGFGLAVLEALASDLPVVTSDLPVFREYLTDGVDALMTRTGDESSLADAMVSLSESPALRRRLTLGGQRTALRYTWEASVAVHRKVYECS
jgi:glycosyltransferase-like protein